MEEIREGSIRRKTTDLRSTHKVERVQVGRQSIIILIDYGFDKE